MAKKKEKGFKEPNTENIILLGNAAQQALNNIAIKAAVNELKQDYFRVFDDSRPLEREGREAIWQDMQALKRFEIKLTGMVNRMIAEKKQIQQKEADENAG